MIVALKNDTLRVKYLSTTGTWELEKRLKDAGLVAPEMMENPSGDPLNPNASLPPMLGVVVDFGPGQKTKTGFRKTIEGQVNVGDTVLFQVFSSQIAYREKDTQDIMYLLGMGNVLAVVE